MIFGKVIHDGRIACRYDLRMDAQTRFHMHWILENDTPGEGYFHVGDDVLMGKWKNKRGKVVAFSVDKWGNPTVEIEPNPKGRKKNKIMGLYRIWHPRPEAPVTDPEAEEEP